MNQGTSRLFLLRVCKRTTRSTKGVTLSFETRKGQCQPNQRSYVMFVVVVVVVVRGSGTVPPKPIPDSPIPRAPVWLR